MTFDPQAYAVLQQANPAAAASYLAAFQAPAAPAAPAPQAQPQPTQGYSNPAAVQPAPQLARGTLEDFYNQPTGGSAPSVTSKFFTKRAQGSWLQLEVARDVTNADVRQQTTPDGKPQTFRDGRPKFVLVVPVKVTGSSDGTHVSEFPDGEGSLWVKGTLADELRRAMTAAGDPSGYPKGGAQIVMQSAGEKASRTPGFSATKLYNLQYAGPVGQAAEQYANSQADLQAVAQAANPLNPTTQIPSATIPAAPSVATVAAPVTAAPALSVPSVPAGPAPSLPPAGVLPTTPSAPGAVPAPNFTAPPPPAPEGGPDKNALLAKLHGQG